MVTYLSRTQVAQHIGVLPSSLSKYRLPPPDAVIGTVRGWSPATIDQWLATRPGRGARTDLAGPQPPSLPPGAV